MRINNYRNSDKANKNKKIENYFKENGIEIGKIEYSPISKYETLMNPEFLEAFEPIFFRLMDAIIEEVFIKYAHSDEMHPYIKKYISKFFIKDVPKDKINEMMYGSVKPLLRNKLNRDRIFKAYIKQKDSNIIDECMSKFIEGFKGSLYLRRPRGWHDELEKEEEEELTILDSYRPTAEEFAFEYLQIFEKFEINVVEAESINNSEDIISVSDEDSELVRVGIDDKANVELLKDNEIFTVTAGNIRFKSDGVPSTRLNTSASTTFTYFNYLCAAEKLEDLLEDNTLHLLGNYIKFIYNLAKYLDESNKVNVLCNIDSIDESKEVCSTLLIMNLISPLDILNMITTFAIKSIGLEESKE